LSGLTEDQIATLKAQAVDATEAGKEMGALGSAKAVCAQAVRSAVEMVASRAGIRRKADGSWS
jgi:hypothetical protein